MVPERIISLAMALERFHESLNTFHDPSIEKNQQLYRQIRDSVIKRFEFCVDLFWKCLKDLLNAKFGIEIASPKASLRECLAQKIITTDEYNLLVSMIDDRNNTAHCYNEELAQEIADRAQNYYQAMKTIQEKIDNHP